ncbi:uncharacterized protein LOC125231708 [Leguminivora glycinivorella]|uniref:uncharacterized protein LOC125231708 n=1 Tax=Leguminivora glycinivorella TaxID=1035111 RepID=UPI0020100523|nr:uncharacterized protein LOC125231708 [Leguminivora glycinivorella]
MEATEKCCDTQFKVLSTGDYILPPPLQASIDKIVEKEGYISHKTINRSISTSGGNFLADLFEVDIKGKTADGDKETNIFIKNKMEDIAVTVLDVSECYNLENFFYGDLSKMYDDIQNKANIPIEERYNMVKSYDATNPNAIILENLSKKGFTTVHRMEVAPLKFAQLSAQQLARFHGLSWVLEKQNPDYFAKKIRTIKPTYKLNDDYQKFVDNMATYTDKCVDGEKRVKLKKFGSRMMEAMQRNYFENDDSRCCLCHGDYRANNILVKKDGEEIIEVIPVDYQLLYYGCPALDFIYFIFPCTDQEFRRQHLDDLKDLYYESLRKFLQYFNMDVESVYPRDEFEREYKKRLEYGLTIALLLTPVLFTNDDDVPDIAHDDLGSISVTPDLKMDERIRGLVDDFEKWHIL